MDPKLDDVLKAIAFSTNVSFRLDQDIYYIDAAQLQCNSINEIQSS